MINWTNAQMTLTELFAAELKNCEKNDTCII